MSVIDIGKFQDRDEDSKRYAHRAAQRVSTDAEAAREMFHTLIGMSVEDPEFRLLFRTLLDSCLIDSITNKMQFDDAFALVMGRRIVTLMYARKSAPAETRRPIARDEEQEVYFVDDQPGRFSEDYD